MAALLPARIALAADWTLKLSMNLAEAYSDNIRMATRGNEQRDWVTQISPGLAVTAVGPRLKLSTQYQMQNMLYANNRPSNTTKHQLNANAHTELVNDQLFLDGNASVGQQSISALAPQAMSNINITANRANVMTLTISPYLKNHFQDMASSEVRYTHGVVNTTAVGLANNQTDRLALKLDSGSAFRSLLWNIDYSKQRSSYSNYVQAINNQSVTGNLRYMVSPRLSLNAGTGYEKSDYISIARQPVGAFYSVGFSWEPSERTTLGASTGHRFYGNSYSFNAKHRSRKTTWDASYSEDLTTTQAQFLFNAANPVQPLPGPANLLSNRVFLQKRLQTSVTLNGKRNVLMLTLYDSLRDAQTPQTQNLALLGPANLAQGDRTKQLGGSAFWSSKISPHTTTRLNLGYVRNNLPTAGITAFDRNIQFGITTQWQTDLSSLVEWRHNQHTSSQRLSDFRENTLTASLLMQF